MNIKIKMTGLLYEELKNDLARPHPFAAEHVGFVFGKLGSLSGEAKTVILTHYHSIPDDQYEEDETVGARIGGKAMSTAMQAVFRGRSTKEGIFHIHIHDHLGQTGMSWVDAEGLPPMMPGFQNMGRQAAHGIIILSRDHGIGWVWLPGYEKAIRAKTLSILGSPIGIFEQRTIK
jgi:hypothetical protein